MSTSITRRSWLPIVVLVLASVVACDAGDRTTPTGVPDPRVAARDTVPTGAGGGTGSGQGTRSLTQWEVDEKARVAAEQEAQKTVYDSLKNIWQDVLDDETGAWDGIMVCDPLQYVATVKIVGPEGGDVDFGPHKLRIPAGALSQAAVITAEAPTSLQVLARFSPHGTVFAAGRHPTLELSYKHCRNPPGHTARIGYLGPDGQIIEWPPSQDFPEWALVRGWIGHFSSYIVAY